MLAVARAPQPALSAFVESVWALSDAPAHTRERIVPSGTFELVINLAEDEFRIYDSPDGNRCRRFPGAMISGVYAKPFVIDTRVHASIVGVHFRPGGASRFLGVRADELADTHVDLADLWGFEARLLRERLCAAPTTELQFRVLESALLKRMSSRDHHHRAVRFALEKLSAEGASVATIATDVGLSHRRLIEVFAREVGMTPKRFGSIRRFQRALALALRSQERDWTELALDAGYCDHAHLIRDFVAFSGFTPAEYRRRYSEHVKLNHLALP
jgi:AraC-like DNA-binding protein